MTRKQEKTALSVDELLTNYSPTVNSLVHGLWGLVREVKPDAAEHVHAGWKTISFEGGVYIAPLKEGANLGFYKGVHLPDPENLLEGTGKELRHVKIRKESDVKPEPLKRLIREAFAYKAPA